MNVQVVEASRARARANVSAKASRTSGRSGRQTRVTSVVARARGEATDVDARADEVNRRRAMLAIFGGASALSAGAESARADVGGYFSNLLVEKPPPPKREILLPDLEVTPLTREEGYRGTTGANKSKAQIEFAQYIAPIIEENVELDFGSYFRLALADLGSYFVVGKKNGLNGSVRFELDRPENAGLRPAFQSIEKIKKAVDAKTTQPITYADLIAIVPHFAARKQFRADYVAEMGTDKDYEFLFIGTNPFLGAKIRIGRRDAETADPEGLIPLANANGEDLLTWFRRMGLGPNELAALAPYLYEDPQKGIDIVGQNGTCSRLLEVYETQRILGKRAPGPAVTIIKNLKQLTDQCITGGPLSVAPAQLDPLYVDYAFIKGGGEIPRVSATAAYPNSIYDSGSKLAMQLRAAQAEQRAQAGQ
jgi:L-ascorbate peroxidase|tara:strand:+ start:3536 stop:4801 length:1266 start_codon:yes stop_codon:yes gene_type:complete